MSGVVSAPSYPVSIYIAGDYAKAVALCQRHCDALGLCVTVERCVYVYTGGQEDGVRVGLINYPRFPKTPDELDEIATDLAGWLRIGLSQESFTVETPRASFWHSWRGATGDHSQ